ncbi:uncharacterized protein LOC135948677 [Calliphora vicina]|uniref:uncharacterized protein LOC135948677 n=1 Tax=Calliphora vicina TaxID=7373 RepID=UPI00325BB143
MSVFIKQEKKTRKRNRFNPVKKWDHNDEAAIINFLKQHREFEKPTARMYYTKFTSENAMDIYWKLVYYKVRNMHTVYRRAKEYQMNRGETNDMDAEAMRNIMLKICWYVDDFDLLFPNEIDDNIGPNSQEPSSDDGDESESSNKEYDNIKKYENINIENNNLPNNSFNVKYLREEPSVCYFPKSIGRDILAVQTGKYNFKRRIFFKETTKKQQELELARENFNMEKEKFQLEMKIKEKQFNTQEKLKIMELQMKERIAMKELELKEKLELKSIKKKQENISYNNAYVP